MAQTIQIDPRDYELILETASLIDPDWRTRSRSPLSCVLEYAIGAFDRNLSRLVATAKPATDDTENVIPFRKVV